MRLNRSTILLLVGSLVVIIAVAALGSQRATAPDVTPDATEEGYGPIFPDIADTTAQNDIARFEVVNNTDNTRVVMTKDAAGVWTLEESASPSDLATDQIKAVGTMSILASLVATASFSADNLADFGLDQPKFTLMLTKTDNTIYSVKIGNPSPANPRYYALVNDNTDTVYMLPKDLIDNLTRQITQPPYVPSPTPTITPTRTPNPFSEVEQTATAAAQQTATAQATLEMTAEATEEADGTLEVTASP